MNKNLPLITPPRPTPKVIVSRVRADHYAQAIACIMFGILLVILLPFAVLKLIFGLPMVAWGVVGLFYKSGIRLDEKGFHITRAGGQIKHSFAWNEIIRIQSEKIRARLPMMRTPLPIGDGFQVITISFLSGDKIVISQGEYENYGMLKRKLYEEVAKVKSLSGKTTLPE